MYSSVLRISYCSFTNVAQISRHKYEIWHGMGGQKVEMHIKHEYCFFVITVALCTFRL